MVLSLAFDDEASGWDGAPHLLGPSGNFWVLLAEGPHADLSHSFTDFGTPDASLGRLGPENDRKPPLYTENVWCTSQIDNCLKSPKTYKTLGSFIPARIFRMQVITI